MTDFTGWIPVRIHPQGDEYWVDWLRLGTEPLDEPFFQQSIQKLITHPFHQAFRQQTPVRAMLDWAHTSPGLKPDGFIFHTSRCGSTLLARMLSALRGSVSLSEPVPLDTLLRARHHASAWLPGEHVQAMQALMSAMAQERMAASAAPRRHVFVKTDAWNILDADHLRTAFPETPWIFLYRDPVEILVSQYKQRATYLIPGMMAPDFAGMQLMEAITMEPVEYSARMIGSLMQRMVAQYNPDTTVLVNYNELPLAMTERILPHLGICPDEDELTALSDASRPNAKHPIMAFSPDSAAKQAEADAHIRAMADRWMGPHYQQLEALRKAQPGHVSHRPTFNEALT